MANQNQIPVVRAIPASRPEVANSGPTAGANRGQWQKGVCPNCGYPKADVDPDGLIWCAACGYAKKGCYT